MVKYIIVLLIFIATSVFAQIKSDGSMNKIIRISNESKIIIQKLDSLYLSACDGNSTTCAFPNKMDTISACLGNLMTAMVNELEMNHIVWQVEPRLHIKCYFNENGDIDYFSYLIKDTSFIRYDDFEIAIKNFVSYYNFGLRSDNKYAQCATINSGLMKK